MEGFYYSSSSTHGVMTPQGRKTKTTNVKVENSSGTLTMTVQDNDGAHSDTRKLTNSEIKNIKKHRFMPNLFKSLSLRGNTSKNHRKSKKGTRKHK